MRKIFLLFFVFVMVLLVAACQATPTEAAVKIKGETPVSENAGNEIKSEKKLLSMQKLPLKNYTSLYENELKTLTIEVDAVVSVPENEKLPMWEVQPMQFSQEMVTGIFNYLFHDEKPSTRYLEMTRSEIENYTIYIKQELASGKSGGTDIDLTPEGRAYLESELERLEQLYSNAPEERGVVISDGKLSYDASTKCMQLNVFMPGREYNTFTVTTEYDSDDPSGLGEGMADSHMRYINTQENFSTEGAVKISAENEDTIKNKPDISFSDAVALADGIFAAAGIHDISLFESYVVDNHGTGLVDSDHSPASEYAYKLYYSRNIDGVNVANVGEEILSVVSENDDDYDIPWNNESITVIVGNDGILYFEWLYPCDVVKCIAEDVPIIDIETAFANFEDAVLYTYLPLVREDESGVTLSEKHFYVDSIKIAPMRLKQKDAPGKYIGVYTPAYLFYGSLVSTDINNKNNEFSHSVASNGLNLIFAINAVDGSIINPLQGY